MWTPDTIRAFRQQRGQSQEAFADALGVTRPTVSEWERGKVAVSVMGVAALDRLAAVPRDTSQDYWRGVLYAAEAMAETTARLLREARQADEETVRRIALAALPALRPIDQLPHPETASAGPHRDAPPARTAPAVPAKRRG